MNFGFNILFLWASEFIRASTIICAVEKLFPNVAAKAKKLVLDVDPTAFISITETSEVLGLKKHKKQFALKKQTAEKATADK